MVLRPPVEPMLAQAREAIPLPGAMPGGMLIDPKFDGFRALLFTPLDTGQPVLLQSRRGAMYQARFPDLIAAAEDQLPPRLVLDGELAVLEHGHSASPPCSAGLARFAKPGPWPMSCLRTSSPSTSSSLTAKSSSISPRCAAVRSWKRCSPITS